MADRMSGGKMADLLSHVLHVISRALQSSRHKEHMKALSTAKTFGIIGMPDEQEVTQTIDLGITTENMNGLFHIASCECSGNLFEHIFKRTRHARKMVNIFH